MRAPISPPMKALLSGLVALWACTTQTQASSVICTPSQLVRCNNCNKPAGDPRVYRGWIQCSADGTQFVGACNDCLPDVGGNDGGSSGSSSGSIGMDSGSSDGDLDGPFDPPTLEVSGTLDQPVAVMSVPGGGMVSTTATGSASTLRYSVPTPTDALDANDAQSVTLTPALGACTGTVTFSLTVQTGAFDFEGTDIPPATDCADYAAELKASGIVAVFQGVPYLNSGNTASQATLYLTPPTGSE